MKTLIAAFVVAVVATAAVLNIDYLFPSEIPGGCSSHQASTCDIAQPSCCSNSVALPPCCSDSETDTDEVSGLLAGGIVLHGK